MRQVSCQFDREDTANAFVVVIDDHFGKTYQRFNERHKPGEIFKSKLYNLPERQRTTPMSEGEYSMYHVRILANVHHNTVRAVLRRSKYPNHKLAPGHWHEVLCD